MVLTMAAVADHKGIPLSDLQVEVSTRSTGEGHEQETCFQSTIRLGGDLTPRERRLLFNAARTCEVHKMLGHPVRFEETLA